MLPFWTLPPPSLFFLFFPSFPLQMFSSNTNVLGTGLSAQDTGIMRLHHLCLHGHESLGLNFGWIANIKGSSSAESAWLLEKSAMSMESPPLVLRLPQLLVNPWLSSVREEEKPTNKIHGVESIPAHSKQEQGFSQHCQPISTALYLKTWLCILSIHIPALLLHSCVTWSKLLNLSVSRYSIYLIDSTGLNLF